MTSSKRLEKITPSKRLEQILFQFEKKKYLHEKNRMNIFLSDNSKYFFEATGGNTF